MSKLQTMTFRIEGVRYTFRVGPVSGEEYRLYKAATGQALPLFDSEQTSMGLDTLAAMVWIARRQAGERKLGYLEVEKTLTIEAVQTLEVDIEDDEVADGEYEDPNA